MGFDKPDLAFVLHYQMRSVIAYYQQVGRAGRGIEKARGILLHGVEDDEIHTHFIKKAFPSRRVVERILEAVGNAEDGLSKYQILRRVNVPYGQVDKALKLLSLESPAPIVEEDKALVLDGHAIFRSFLGARRAAHFAARGMGANEGLHGIAAR